MKTDRWHGTIRFEPNSDVPLRGNEDAARFDLPRAAVHAVESVLPGYLRHVLCARGDRLCQLPQGSGLRVDYLQLRRASNGTCGDR